MKTTKAVRRGSGEGSWQHLGNNKWKVTITVGIDMTGKQIRRSKTGTKTECQNWFKTHQECFCDDYFYDYATKYLKLKKNSLSESTYRQKLLKIKAIAKINNFKINKVNDSLIANIIDTLLLTLKTSTVNLYISELTQILQHAFYQRHIISLPYIPKIKQFEEVKKVEILTIEEIKQVLILAKFYDKKTIYPVLLLAFVTGMRLGEILALTTNDINLEKSTITINKTLSTNILNKPYIKQGAKTKKSNREIYVNKNILEEFLKYVNHNNKQGFFYTFKSKLKAENNVSGSISLFFAKCGYKLSSHKARHMFITLAQRHGVNFVFIGQYVGHTLNSTTLNVYTHSEIDKPNDKLNEFVSLIFS